MYLSLLSSLQSSLDDNEERRAVSGERLQTVGVTPRQISVADVRELKCLTMFFLGEFMAKVFVWVAPGKDQNVLGMMFVN